MTRLREIRRIGFAIAVMGPLLTATCGGTPTGPLDTGIWGGTGISMTVTASGASLEFDCATGLITGRIVLEDAAFSLPGVVVLEHGGPAQENEAPDVRNATYKGALSGSLLRLDIVLDDGTPMGPFEARRDRDPNLHKCL